MERVIVAVIVLFSLFSCGGESKKDPQDIEMIKDTVLDDFSYLEMKIDTIDSTNHTKFLDKDGYYKATWNMLLDVKISQRYFHKHQAEGMYPEFGISPLFLNAKNIKIDGYIIPLNVPEKEGDLFRYFVSFYPNSMCFYCGKNGPESIMELKLKPNQRKLREDEYVTVKGKLLLNNGNPFLLPYNLYDVEIVE
jgi:hypothetical protein